MSEKAIPDEARPALDAKVKLDKLDNIEDVDAGKIATNIMHFARVLRSAGLPIGPGKVIEGIKAAETIGIDNREDFYWALHSVFVSRRDQREIFDQAFHIFWRNPKLLERMASLALPYFVDPDAQQQAEEIGAVKADAKRPYFLTPARQHTAARAGALRLPPARHPLVRPGHRARRSRARAPPPRPRAPPSSEGRGSSSKPGVGMTASPGPHWGRAEEGRKGTLSLVWSCSLGLAFAWQRGRGEEHPLWTS